MVYDSEITCANIAIEKDEDKHFRQQHFQKLIYEIVRVVIGKWSSDAVETDEVKQKHS